MKYTVFIDDVGNQFWYKYKTTTLHREGNLPAVEGIDGGQTYYVNGKHHRTNGPAWDFPHIPYYAFFLEGVKIPVKTHKEFAQHVSLMVFQ